MDILLGRVGEIEDEVFRRRKMADDNEKLKRQRQSAQSKEANMNRGGGGYIDNRKGERAPSYEQSRSPFAQSNTMIANITYNNDMKPNVAIQQTLMIESQATVGNANSLAAQKLKLKFQVGEKRKLEEDSSGVTDGGGIESKEQEWDEKVVFEPIKHIKLEKHESASSTSSIQENISALMIGNNDADNKQLEFNLSLNTQLEGTLDLDLDVKKEVDALTKGETDDIEVAEEDPEEEEEAVLPFLSAVAPLAALATSTVKVADTDTLKGTELAKATLAIKNRLKKYQESKIDEMMKKNSVEYGDNVRLHEDGWKKRYVAYVISCVLFVIMHLLYIF